jgi:hypothetical protein
MNSAVHRAMLLVTLCLLQACAEAPPVVGAAQADTVLYATKEPRVSPYTVDVSMKSPVTIPEAELHIALVDVADSRCPVGTQCLWAGHAAVTLQVGMIGAEDTQTLVIGTHAPAGMQLPGDADFAAFRFSLLSLEPARSAKATTELAAYRATVQISTR